MPIQNRIQHSFAIIRAEIRQRLSPIDDKADDEVIDRELRT
jgi:hypothetical protein